MSTSLYGPGKEQGQQDSCTGVATAFTIISGTSPTIRSECAADRHIVIIVGLRSYTRAYIVNSFGKDDWAMIAAVVSCCTFTTSRS